MAVARAVLVLLASTAQAWMPDANARIHIKYGKILINIIKQLLINVCNGLLSACVVVIENNKNASKIDVALTS